MTLLSWMLSHGNASLGASSVPLSKGRCVIWLDRHVPKNGGTSVRDAMKSLQSAGYLKHAPSWKFTLWEWQELLQALVSGRDGPICNGSHNAWAGMRFAIESHQSYGQLSGWLMPLRHLRRQRSCCKILLTTRVREPLDWYVSLFRWGAIPQFPQRKGYNHSRLFLHWAAPNLQSFMLMHGYSHATLLGTAHAQGVGPSWNLSSPDPIVQSYLRANRSMWDESRGLACGVGACGVGGWVGSRSSESRDHGSGSGGGSGPDFDLIYPLEVADDGARRLAELLELPSEAHRLMMGVHAIPVWGRTSGGVAGEARDKAVEEICPDRRRCEERIAEVAPLDHALYAAVRCCFARGKIKGPFSSTPPTQLV